jgi:RNA polymerase sigma factor (sigma-70 family)
MADMAQQPNSPVLRYFHKLFEQEELSALTDRQLLQRFAGQRNEAAFSALVRRHGPMVLGVCDRVLKDATDAEDAVQATFLVLARKSGGFGWQDSIGNWLYGVALRVAFKMRSQRQRTRDLAASVQEAALAGGAVPDASAEAIRQELAEKLDDSLRRLPEKYRSALVLGYLEGKTHQEVARELKVPVGSVSRHMARGLDLLRDRLNSSGFCVSLEFLATLLARESWRPTVQPALVDSICELALALRAGALVASGTVSARILTLAEGVGRTMFITQLKYVAAVFFAVGALGVGGVMQGPWHGGGVEGTAGLEQDSQAKSPDSPPALNSAQTAENVSTLNRAEWERKHRLMWNTLTKPVVLDKGLEKMTLGEAKQYFEDRFQVLILTDTKAFKLAGVDSPLEVDVKLDRVSGIPLRHVLGLLADQLNATIVTLPDHLVITTLDAVRPESWIRGDRTLVPSVYAEFKDVPLDEALRELALQTGISVILDQRNLEAMPRVTALLNNVCLDTAVEILANMCGMKSVALDRSLYVTNLINATEMIEERDRQRNAQAAKQQKDDSAPQKAGEKQQAKDQPKKK